MSKRSYSADIGEEPSHTDAPAQRVWWPAALREAVDDPCSLLNPRATHSTLMCNDVVELVRQCVAATTQVVAAVGIDRAVGCYNPAQARWVSYDFDRGWCEFVGIDEPERGCKLYAVRGAVCRRMTTDFDAQHLRELRRWRDKKLIYCVPMCFNDLHLFGGPDCKTIIPTDNHVFLFDKNCRVLWTAVPDASGFGNAVVLPSAMHYARRVRHTQQHHLFFTHGWAQHPPESSVKVSWGSYDLHAAQLATHQKNFELVPCPDVAHPSSELLPVAANSLIAITDYYMKRIDLRSHRVYSLRAAPRVARLHQSLLQVVDDELWVVLDARATMYEYDVRADRWRTPHSSLALNDREDVFSWLVAHNYV